MMRGIPRIERAGGELVAPARLQLRAGREFVLAPAGGERGDLALRARGSGAGVVEDLLRALGESGQRRLGQTGDFPLPASGLAVAQAEPLPQVLGESCPVRRPDAYLVRIELIDLNGQMGLRFVPAGYRICR